jgi:hypothetical protein
MSTSQILPQQGSVAGNCVDFEDARKIVEELGSSQTCELARHTHGWPPNILWGEKRFGNQRGRQLRRLGALLQAADARRDKIEHLKRNLTAAILQSVKGLSARQAESITGLHATTISRLRRGIDRDYSLELLVRAAIKIGVPVDIHIGKPPRRTLSNAGREGMYRPTKNEWKE